MIHEIFEIQEINTLQIDLLVLDHLQFHVLDIKFLVLDIVIVLENSIRTELHQVGDTLTFITSGKTLGLHTILLSKIIALVLFLHSTSENDSFL